MDDTIVSVIGQISAAVETQLNPFSTQTDRAQAYRFLEELKTSCDTKLLIEASFQMCSPDKPDIIRHIGLQFIENCIVDRWNDMNPDIKLSIKNITMQLLANGTKNIIAEQLHIKDALSRITVEMIKREWPQQWPTLMKELNDLRQMGPSQTELVLFVFLRLAEDVVHFQNIPTKRRREILTSLTSAMTEIFSFFIDVLKASVQQHQANPETDSGLMMCKVASSTLSALYGYVDWVSMSHITANNNLLLQMLCLLLADKQLRLPAANCLLEIVERKGKPEDRKPLMILFSEDAMSTILDAARVAALAGVDEENYIFLKKLCQVLTAVGNQLCYLWGHEHMDIGQPTNFEAYLQALMAFTHHHSLVLGDTVYSQWSTFLRHKHISQDPIFISILCPLIMQATVSLQKYGFPSRSDSKSCDYARLDFDSDEEFIAFFSKFRCEISAVVRETSLLVPHVTFQIATEWLDRQLKKPIDLGEGNKSGMCNSNSPSFIEWDALSVFLECVLTKINLSEATINNLEGIRLLKDTLAYETRDPVILSSVLSCISTLFIFVTHAPDILPIVLKKVFDTVVFNLEGQTKSTRIRAVLNVRRHACSILVKICKSHPRLLLPGFDQFFNHITAISSDPEGLSQMEKCTLNEALILISNEFYDFQKQSEFLKVIISPVNDIWLSDEMKMALSSTDNYLTYIGLNQPPVEPSSADVCGINRSQVTYCLNLVLAAIKRSKWPDDIEDAKQGCFIGENGLLRNPATQHISLMLSNLFPLLRIMNEMWLPENKAKLHPAFSEAMNLEEREKLAVLGIQPPSVDNADCLMMKKPQERMQAYIHLSYDSCYHILGNAGLCLGAEFYMAPGLANLLLESVFTNLHAIPDYSLRSIIRSFLKPFIQQCLKESYNSLILPILGFLCPFMFKRLEAKWVLIHQRYQDGLLSEDDTNPESQEVLEDQLCRQLTREYLDILGFVCRSQNSGAVVENNLENDCKMSVKEDSTISELGIMAIQNEATCQYMVLTVFTGLTWNDSTTCRKCINLGGAILLQLVAENLVTVEAACHLFRLVLNALTVHGEHEGTQAPLIGLACLVYSTLRPLYSELTAILMTIPNCSAEVIQNFDENILGLTNGKPASDKRKKDAFKKLIIDVIGRSVAQLFKKEVHIVDLPVMFKQKKPKPAVVEGTGGGLCDLFGEDRCSSIEIELKLEKQC
ncbi:exportin-5-like [Tubulanus polymorphus]|uniref:exportin-5-like n=1 Tax=Tubulanus polymorphus TaxID=672921 RepID=UPI003DA43B8B